MIMVKRACVLVLALAGMLLAFVGCGGGGADDAQSVRIPARGVWRDNVFTNEYLGLRFEMPRGWTASTDLDLEKLSDRNIFGTIASSPDSGASVHILFRRLDVVIMGISESDYMASVAEQADVSFDSYGRQRLGSHVWYSYGTAVHSRDGSYYGRYFISIEDGFVRVVSFLYNDHSESLEELLAMFSAL